MLVIKGCIYTNGNALLRCHHTGDFVVVDCDEFLTVEEMDDRDYRQLTTDNIVENSVSLTYDGKPYYDISEYSPYLTENLKLLTDVNDIEYFDDCTSF